MAYSLKHFWRHILRRTAKRVTFLHSWNDFCQAKVRNLDVTINIDENVLRFEVAINDIEIMEVLDPEQNLAKIKLGQFFRKTFKFAQVEEDFTACADIDNKEQLVLILEGPVHLHYERVVNLLQYLSLRNYGFYFLFSNDFVFL